MSFNMESWDIAEASLRLVEVLLGLQTWTITPTLKNHFLLTFSLWGCGMDGSCHCWIPFSMWLNFLSKCVDSTASVITPECPKCVGVLIRKEISSLPLGVLWPGESPDLNSLLLPIFVAHGFLPIPNLTLCPMAGLILPVSSTPVSVPNKGLSHRVRQTDTL